MTLDPSAAAAGIEDRLSAVGTPESAAGAKRYLKSDLVFLGATVPEVRREIRTLCGGHRDLSRDTLIALVEALWAPPVFERRLAAALLLAARPDALRPSDLVLLLRLVRESGTWALVDVLAIDTLGELMLRHSVAVDGLDSWARDEDFWVRRAALLAWLKPLRAGAPLERFTRDADPMLVEREFFIRKAIGWVLRETGKQRPDEVYAWLAPRVRRASGVTMREAVKYLQPTQRDALTLARRSG